MRQAGIVAAGCLHALDHHVERLAEDHANAQHLAAGLVEIEGVRLTNAQPETNIVFFDVSGLGVSNEAFVSLMAQRGVKLAAVRDRIRAVTHLDVSRADIDVALAAAREIATLQSAKERARTH
jgi:threonine aldolase